MTSSISDISKRPIAVKLKLTEIGAFDSFTLEQIVRKIIFQCIYGRGESDVKD